MKLRLIITTAIVGVTLAVPSASSAQAPTQDSVTSQPGMPFIVSLDASSGPLGENPTGVVAWHEGGGFGTTWSGDVSCLSVSGNTAVIGFGGGTPFRLLRLLLDRRVDQGGGQWIGPR
jgi:hypothetical protein